MTSIANPPDIETSSDRYALRFAGAAGSFMLDRQQKLTEQLLADKQQVTMLDVGGGHAQLCGPLAAAGHLVTVLGSTRECANRLGYDPRNASVGFIQGSITRLPFADASFDTVIAIRLMAHSADWRLLIAEMCRVARRSVVIDYPVWTSSNALSLLTFAIKKRIEGDTRPYRSFWGPEIASQLRRSGARISATRRQFALPMALHRNNKNVGAIQQLESGLARYGITSMFGNPILLRADLG